MWRLGMDSSKPVLIHAYHCLISCPSRMTQTWSLMLISCAQMVPSLTSKGEVGRLVQWAAQRRELYFLSMLNSIESEQAFIFGLTKAKYAVRFSFHFSQNNTAFIEDTSAEVAIRQWPRKRVPQRTPGGQHDWPERELPQRNQSYQPGSTSVGRLLSSGRSTDLCELCQLAVVFDNWHGIRFIGSWP
jgi:hypothetical protein